MAQMWHTTANLTLSVYAKAMAWRDWERARLRALVEDAKWQGMGNTAPTPAPAATKDAVA